MSLRPILRSLFRRARSEPAASSAPVPTPLAPPEMWASLRKTVQATVMMTDLSGFDELTTATTAEQLISMLNEYLTSMNRIIVQHQGTLIHFEGDVMQLMFGAPIPQSDHAVRALRCAVDMQRAVAEEHATGRNPFQLRVGIATGEVVAGPIGGGGRYDYQAVGYPSVLAGWLCELNRHLGSNILCSEPTFRHAAHLINAELKFDVLPHEEATKRVNLYVVHAFKERT